MASKDKIYKLLATYDFDGIEVAADVADAFAIYLAGDTSAAYKALVSAVAKAEFLCGPLNWVNHPEYISPSVDLEAKIATAEYRGSEYTVDLSGILD